MAITFVTIGAAAVGTTSLSVAPPASLVVGNILILAVSHKYGAVPATPANWTYIGDIAGGVGANGLNAGQVRISLFGIRIGAGGFSGNTTVTLTAGNGARGIISQWAKTLNGGTVWEWPPLFVGGSNNIAGLAWAVTAGSTLAMAVGDLILACSAVNGSPATFSAEALTALGLTFSGQTERDDGSTTSGDDLAQFMSEHTVATGSATVAPIYAAVASATSGSTPAGATGFIRLRELPGLPGGDVATGVADSGVTTEDTAAHNVHYEADLFKLTDGESSFPVIDNFVPASGSSIHIADSVRLDVTDPGDNLQTVLIGVIFSTGATETVWNGSAFTAGYSASSLRTVITRGFRFLVIRTAGWPGTVVAMAVSASDISLNHSSASPAWTVISTVPVVGNYIPSQGTQLALTDTIQFDTTDVDGDLGTQTVAAIDANGDSEPVWNGAAFVSPYLSSTRNAIANGFRFVITRTDGWTTALVALRIAASDAVGKTTTDVPTWPTELAGDGTYRMRGFDTTLGFAVYWTARDVDLDASAYEGPGPVNQIVVFKVVCLPA